jgi:hypothetical protein
MATGMWRPHSVADRSPQQLTEAEADQVSEIVSPISPASASSARPIAGSAGRYMSVEMEAKSIKVLKIARTQGARRGAK